jgi:RNase P subunit RPR2
MTERLIVCRSVQDWLACGQKIPPNFKQRPCFKCLQLVTLSVRAQEQEQQAEKAGEHPLVACNACGLAYAQQNVPHRKKFQRSRLH